MSSDVGVLHLLDVQEKLQKFHLQESQVKIGKDVIRGKEREQDEERQKEEKYKERKEEIKRNRGDKKE